MSRQYNFVSDLPENHAWNCLLVAWTKLGQGFDDDNGDDELSSFTIRKKIPFGDLIKGT